MKKKILMIVACVLAGLGLITLICVAVDSIFFIHEKEATITYFTTSGRMTNTPRDETSMPALVYEDNGKEITILPGREKENAYTPWLISITTHGIFDDVLVNTRNIKGEDIMTKNAGDTVKISVDSRQPDNMRPSPIFWPDLIIGIILIIGAIVCFVLSKK